MSNMTELCRVEKESFFKSFLLSLLEPPAKFHKIVDGSLTQNSYENNPLWQEIEGSE